MGGASCPLYESHIPGLSPPHFASASASGLSPTLFFCLCCVPTFSVNNRPAFTCSLPPHVLEESLDPHTRLISDIQASPTRALPPEQLTRSTVHIVIARAPLGWYYFHSSNSRSPTARHALGRRSSISKGCTAVLSQLLGPPLLHTRYSAQQFSSPSQSGNAILCTLTSVRSHLYAHLCTRTSVRSPLYAHLCCTATVVSAETNHTDRPRNLQLELP